MRSRIRTTLIGNKDDVIPKHLHEISDDGDLGMIPSEFTESGRVLPFLALNEVDVVTFVK